MKNKIKKRILIPLLGIIGVAVILGQFSFQPISTFPSLIPGKEMFAEDPTLVISVKPLDEEESNKYLKIDALKYGYRPVQITIENQSSDPYLINPESISLPLVASKKVASSSKRSSLPATIGLKIAGFIFWPFSIPSMMHGIKVLQNQQLLKKELAVKSVKEEIISPYTTMTRVFFVDSEEYKDSFSVTLINQETLESKIFSISHLKQEASPLLDPIPMPEENYYLTHEK